MASTYILGVDVGGTFTDLVILDKKTGAIWRTKVHSVPSDPSIGVAKGIEDILSKIPDGINAKFETINHGTTIATNAILEGKGAKVALVTTEGFRDILQIRRSHVPGGESFPPQSSTCVDHGWTDRFVGLAAWISWKMPDPLAPLELTVEAPGRIGVDGTEIRRFNEQILEERLEILASEKPEAFAVSLINAFVSDEQ